MVKTKLGQAAGGAKEATHHFKINYEGRRCRPTAIRGRYAPAISPERSGGKEPKFFLWNHQIAGRKDGFQLLESMYTRGVSLLGVGGGGYSAAFPGAGMAVGM
jgi:hypothetical protein